MISQRLPLAPICRPPCASAVQVVRATDHDHDAERAELHRADTAGQLRLCSLLTRAPRKRLGRLPIHRLLLSLGSHSRRSNIGAPLSQWARASSSDTTRSPPSSSTTQYCRCVCLLRVRQPRLRRSLACATSFTVRSPDLRPWSSSGGSPAGQRRTRPKNGMWLPDGARQVSRHAIPFLRCATRRHHAIDQRSRCASRMHAVHMDNA